MPRKSKSQPLFLNSVLKAVATLKDNHGSTASKIVNQVKATLRTSPRLKSRPRNLVLHIRRALRYGVDNGLLKQRAGRYKIDSKHSMKANKSFDDEDYNTSGRRESPGPHLGSRKRTSHSSTASTTASSRSSYTTDASSPTSRSRSRTRHRLDKSKSSRQKRGKRGKGHKRKGRRHCSNTNNDPEPDSRDSRNSTPPEHQPEPEPIPEANPPELKSRPSGSPSRYRQRRSRHNVEDENSDAEMTSVDRDNDDGLCNLKQQRSSHHGCEEGPSDDYIN